MDNLKRNVIIGVLNEVLDDDSDDELIAIVCSSYNSIERKSRVCIRNYVENIVRAYSFDDFKSHFRISRITFENLVQVLGPSLKERNVQGIGRHCHSPDLQLLVSLTMFSNQTVYRLLSDKFDISKSTAWLYVRKVTEALKEVSSIYISWPTGATANNISEKFKERQNFPGVIGAIDGCHILITPPRNVQGSYCNRKGQHSIILQGVCDANYMFLDVFAGFPGSVHDARVFYNSPLGTKMRENPGELFPNNTHILGDSAYKCSNYLLTPYRDNGHLSRKQKNYNFKHSSTRVYVEQTFGLLKGRFRILKHVHMYNVELIPDLILACCVLHNICMKNNDEIDVDTFEDKDDYYNNGDEDFRKVGKREYIADLLMN
ncbi:hypothetical protein PPYR_02295 [Photinus pyralis]|uniref:Putative nuclease HARBI1 n=1 Tax=Photinus pyralis TaxID=7054 RepID=A0A5N4B6V2_PHOPY|nr:putative nuclease HARBI1 [Photinus pyralis]XP_031350705.1 putative nuclease HARBI1 [Photinus pyralis]XP_031351840.1 putative nuclease HARBI1 [Photinus pyralis]KAB0805325.1 hypothetical protein PPYR_02295 [Photinus pyralis]